MSASSSRRVGIRGSGAAVSTLSSLSAGDHQAIAASLYEQPQAAPQPAPQPAYWYYCARNRTTIIRMCSVVRRAGIGSSSNQVTCADDTAKNQRRRMQKMQKSCQDARLLHRSSRLLRACSTDSHGAEHSGAAGYQSGFDSFRADDQDCQLYASRQITVPVPDPGVQSAVVRYSRRRSGKAISVATGARRSALRTGLLMGGGRGRKSQALPVRNAANTTTPTSSACTGVGTRLPVSPICEEPVAVAGGSLRSGNYPPPPSTEPPPDYVPPRWTSRLTPESPALH